ncbi:glycine betaine ABC transporter substrate-binding protein [Methanolobus sp. ZRKC3]|uniref:glycine betaine ABC transporter substrate-binding protein n=1 Tax=Methanolobus sp. ZRKC3 TaxID=3125786 RepID=UPI003244D792
MKYMKILACFMVTLAILVAGCASEVEESVSSEPVKIGVIQWDDSRAGANVFTQILDEGGYEYEIISADLGGLYQATAQGDLDVLVHAWLPATQAPYWEKYGDDLVKAQVVASGAKCGLVVPEYVPINTIEELNDNADKFDNKISGIEPGAGIMQNTESCIVEYDLGNFELYSSSTVGMTAELQDKIDNEEWVVVTLWRPHWSFARIEGLKFLEDTQGIYGESDDLIILTRTGFEEDNPEFYQLIQNFELELSDIESIMIAIDSGKTAEEAAAEWLAENPQKIDEVLGTQ